MVASYEEEVNYYQGNQNQGYQQPYQSRYRPPGFQERAAPRVTTNDDLREMIQNLAKNHEISARSTASELKGVRAHLTDIESWKKGITSQVANLAESVPRPQGQLPGRPEENPRNHQIAAMTIVEISDDSSEEDEEVTGSFRPVRYDTSPGRDDEIAGRQKCSAVRDAPEPDRVLKEVKGKAKGIMRLTPRKRVVPRYVPLESAYLDWKDDDPCGFDDHPEWECEEDDSMEYEQLYPVRYDESPNEEDKEEDPEEVDSNCSYTSPVRETIHPVRDTSHPV